MRSYLVAFVAGVVLAVHSGTASAGPTDDVADWAQRFTQSVLKSDVDAIVRTVGEISDPRLNIDGVRNVVQGAISLTKDETPQYSEQFAEKSVGSFIKRINVAVKYSKNFVFYSVVVVRGDKGWQLIQINIDGNLNKILDAPWPS